MSLERCLIKHHDALKNPEKQEIRAAKEAYMKQGMNAHDASVKALRDEVARLEGSRKSVIEQANEQWKSIDPETHAAAKPSKADLKERAINDVIYNAIEDGASPEEILAHIASHTSKTDKLKSMLARYLIKHVKGVEVKIGTLEQRKNLKFGKNTPNMGKDNEKVGAVYNHLSHRVLLFGNPAEHNIVDLMLHELTHAATMSALVNNTESAKRMKELYALAKKSLPKEDWYGMTDVDEFVAEAFANRNFQEALQEVKYPGASLFTRFVETVRSALGLPSRFTGTLFDHVMATSEGLINENTELNKPGSAWNEAKRQALEGKKGHIAASENKNLTDEFGEAIQSKAEKFGTEAGKLNADMGGLIKLLGANMYASNIADVSVKELLQNAFDATKAAVKTGLIKTGKINITVDSSRRSITVEDNAKGMTPQIVKDAFFTVAGSDKSDLEPGERSGGLGLAKMGFMLGSKELKLDTVRDGVRTVVDTRAEDIANSNFDIVTTRAKPSEHGTKVTVTIPEKYTDPRTGEDRHIWFPYTPEGMEPLTKPLIGNVEVTVSKVGYDGEISNVTKLPIGNNFDEKAMPKITTATFSWGTADIYYGVERTDHPKHRVLSSGVYQFDTYFQKNKNETIPYDIIVNVKPFVEAKHPDYPFENSRERFKSRLEKDIKAMQNYLAKIALGNEAQGLQDSLKNIVSMDRVDPNAEGREDAAKAKLAFDLRHTKQDKPPAEMYIPADIDIGDGLVKDRQGAILARDKEQEKKLDSTFKADKDAPEHSDFMIAMDHDAKKPIFHNNTNLDVLEVGEKYGNPQQFFTELGSILVEMKEEVAESAGASGLYGYDALSPENLFFAGISIDKQYGGLHIKVPYKAVFINPMYSWGAETLRGVAANFYTTMVHELAHQGDMSHGVGHNGEMLKIDQYLADQGKSDYYRQSILKVLTKHESAFTAMRNAYERSSTKNVAKSLEDNGSSSASASTGNDQGKSPDQLRPVQAGGGQGGNGNLQAANGPSGQLQNALGSERVFGKASSLLEGNTNVIDALGHLRRGKIYAQFLNDLKDNYGSLLVDENGKSFLGHYVDKLHNMAATANELLKKGGNIAEKWSELRGEKKALNELAADATTSEIHPDLPLDMQDHQASNGRTISNKHLANDDGTFPKEVIAEHGRLAADWAKLTDKARKVYKDARDHMADNWNKREALLNKRINEIYDPLIKDAERLGNKAKVDELNKERTDFIEEHGKVLGRVKGPYFPLSRFGKYYVVHKSEAYIAAEAASAKASERLRDLYAQYDIPVGTRKELEELKKGGIQLKRVADLSPDVKLEFKDARWAVREANKALEKLVSDGTHYSNEAFESEGQATLRAKELGTKVMLKDDYIRKMSPVTETFMNRISKVIEGSLPEKQALAAREAIMQVWIQSLPDTSAMRSQLKRRKVEGYSRDMLRAFSKNAQADAHYLSRLEHMNELASDLLGMKDASKKSDSLMAKEVYDDVARRHVENMAFVDTPIANMLSGMSFVWQLGISPAFLLTNLSQPWMISMPFMAGRHGGMQSSNALAKAMAQVGKAAATSFNESKSMFFEIDKSKFSKPEQDMLDRAQKQGLLDITLEYDLSAMSKGETNRATQTMRAISSVPHQVEVINRVMTALAAYRLELRKTNNAEEATLYAMRVLDKTHVDYSSINAPSYLKPGFMGGLGKIFFQYRKYQLGMLSLLANQWKQATNGSKEARNALIGMFAMHGAMAGALGLPLAGSAIFIANMINKIFGSDDEPWDAEVAFRNWLADALGIEAGAVAAKGMPLLAGLDVSRRIGLGSVAAPIQVIRGNKKGRDLWLEMLASAAGPTLGGLAPNMADGVNLLGQGETLKGMEKMLPTSMASLIKAYRLSEDGITTSRGAVAVSPDRIDAWDTTMQALGMSPSIVSERGDAVGAVENARTNLKARSGKLEKDWVDARMKGDQEAVVEAKQAIDEYNKVRREKGEPIIRPADLLNAYKTRKLAEKNTTEQGYRVNKREKALGQYGRFADVS